MAPQEKDVVLAIHEDDRMQLKALVAKFKPAFTEKADKDLFMAIVKRVAKFVQDGEDRFVRLNDSTLDQYGLRAPDPKSSGSSSHDSGRIPVAEETLSASDGGGGGGDATLASAGLASSAGLATESCGSSSHDIPVVDEKLMRRLAEQSDKLDTGYSAIENCGSQALPHGQSAALATRELGSCPRFRARLAALGDSSLEGAMLDHWGRAATAQPPPKPPIPQPLAIQSPLAIQAPRRSYNLRNFDPKLVECLEAARQRVGEGESVEPELAEAVAQVIAPAPAPAPA